MRTELSSLPPRIYVSDDARYMTIGDVCEYFRCSRMWVTRRMADAGFPQPIRLGPTGGKRTPHRRWLREDVLAWEAERKRAELHALEHAQPEIGSAAT